MKKVHITSLGCAKNLVDSEIMAGQLKLRGYTLVEKPEDAELIIVNTCGFIQDAKNESIQAIFEALNIKEKDPVKKVYVAGCLTQRYREEICAEIPEIDAVFGTESYQQILAQLSEDTYDPEAIYQVRQLSTPRHFAYLKISEGCDHSCSFCAIPGIRGKHVSRSVDSILAEAQALAKKGVKELILVSQDTSLYGKDLYKKPKILQLLETLAREDMFTWIRPLYWYPALFPLAYVELMNRYPAIIPYLDMPIQHASDRVLHLMRRAETNQRLREFYQNIRSIRPDIALRTTLIVGHPGETEEDFNVLRDFVKEIQYDRLGAFIYSDEDGTAAYNLTGKVDRGIAQQRYSALLELQRQVSFAKNKRLVGTVQKVLIDGYDHDQQFYYGRTYRDAPEIDNEVLIKSPEFRADLEGSYVDVKITHAYEYELYGSFNVYENE